MIILIAGASHTGKTVLAQRLLEKYHYPYLSIDHLKMGLIRSGQTTLTPMDDDKLTDYLWPIVREMVKTAIENGKNLIVEGCYIRSARGTPVTTSGVARILHNRKYIGEYRFQDTIQPNGIPAIVPQELFDRVQERLALTKRAPARNKAEDEYLLTTKLICGDCQRMMVGESGTSHTGATHRYYKCVGAKKHLGCKKKSVKKDWIEGLVLTHIRSVIFDDAFIEQLADRIMVELVKGNTVLPVLRKNLAQTELGIENMLNAIQLGIFTPSTKQRLVQWYT